jgi:hypothetical protein
MKPSLLHTRGEGRHRQSRRRGEAPHVVQVEHRTADPDVKRVQSAGGPVDNASYSCQCGYMFCAAVSTSVSCPHCGSVQAW